MRGCFYASVLFPGAAKVSEKHGGFGLSLAELVSHRCSPHRRKTVCCFSSVTLLPLLRRIVGGAYPYICCPACVQTGTNRCFGGFSVLLYRFTLGFVFAAMAAAAHIKHILNCPHVASLASERVS